MKNLFSLFTLAIVTICNLQAQQNNHSDIFKKHAIGINYTNELTSRLDKPKTHEPSKNYYPLHYGLSVAALYTYRPNKWLSIETGIEYSKSRANLPNLPPDNVYFIMPFEGNCIVEVSRISVPINLRVHYAKKRWNIYAMGGLLLSSNLQSKHIYDSYFATTQYNLVKLDDFKNNFTVGLSAGVGVERAIGNNLLLRIEPRFRLYNLTTKTDSYTKGYYLANDYKYWAMGLNMGLYYTFG